MYATILAILATSAPAPLPKEKPVQPEVPILAPGCFSGTWSTNPIAVELLGKTTKSTHGEWRCMMACDGVLHDWRGTWRLDGLTFHIEESPVGSDIVYRYTFTLQRKGKNVWSTDNDQPARLSLHREN